MRLGICSAFLIWSVASTAPAAHAQASTDWPMFGHDASSTRFSPLTQINPDTVHGLTRSWTYNMKRDSPAGTSAGAIGHGGGRRSSQVHTPNRARRAMLLIAGVIVAGLLAILLAPVPGVQTAQAPTVATR